MNNYMGRSKKYLTKEQQDEARKRRQMEYYWRNQSECNEKNIRRYHQLKSMAITSRNVTLSSLSGSSSE